MLKVVLDTNILVSSIFWSRASYRIVKLITSGKIESYTSIPILNELKQVLQSKVKYNLPKTKIQEIIEFIRIYSTIVYPKKRINTVKDPKDNKFLECGVAVNVDYIISGNKHLLCLKKYENIRIISPKNFLK